jgi:hypothetical protein
MEGNLWRLCRVTEHVSSRSSHLHKKSGFPSLSIGICIVTKEVMEMEERNEASASIWVWVIIIAIAAALVAAFVLFLSP